MSRRIRIGTFTSRNHRGGSRGAGASAPDGCDSALAAYPLEYCAAAGGAHYVALWIGALYFDRDRVRRQFRRLGRTGFGRLPVSRWPLPPWRPSILQTNKGGGQKPGPRRIGCQGSGGQGASGRHALPRAAPRRGWHCAKCRRYAYHALIRLAQIRRRLNRLDPDPVQPAVNQGLLSVDLVAWWDIANRLSRLTQSCIQPARAVIFRLFGGSTISGRAWRRSTARHPSLWRALTRQNQP
jgi:hypothetical protein